MAKLNIKGYIVADEDAWVYDYFGEPCTCPQMANEVIDSLEDGDTLEVEINSYGGRVDAGNAIYHAIRNYNGIVKINIVNMAASAASMIAMAGYCEMEPTAQLMVHNVSALAEGDYHEFEKMSERLQQANRSIAAAYVDKSGMSEEDALKLMDAESWLTAQDAVEYGLVDGILKRTNSEPTEEEPTEEEPTEEEPTEEEPTEEEPTEEDLLDLVANYRGMIPSAIVKRLQNQRRELIEYFNKEA